MIKEHETKPYTTFAANAVESLVRRRKRRSLRVKSSSVASQHAVLIKCKQRWTFWPKLANSYLATQFIRAGSLVVAAAALKSDVFTVWRTGIHESVCAASKRESVWWWCHQQQPSSAHSEHQCERFRECEHCKCSHWQSFWKHDKFSSTRAIRRPQHVWR